MQLETGMIQEAKVRNSLKSWLILVMCIGYLIEFFTNIFFIKVFLAGLCIVVFFSCLPSAKPAPRILGFAMVLTGIVLNILKGERLEGLVEGIISNLPLLTLVILVPIISIPLKMGGYFRSIHFYLEKLCSDPQKMFGSISLFLFCLGPILNLGSIRVLHEMIEDLKIRPVILAKSYLVGFSTVILWSPYFASVAMVLYYLHIPILEYLPLGLSLAVIQLVAGYILFAFWNRKNRISLKEDLNLGTSADILVPNEQRDFADSQRMRRLAGIVLGLFISIFLVEFLTGWPMLVLVSLTSIVFPVVWCTWNRKWKESFPYFESFREHSVPTMNNEIVMFMGAGLFGKALVGTPVADAIKLFLNRISGLSFLLFIFTVLAIILIFTFVGVHQIVVVTVLINQMDPAVIGTSAHVLAMLLMIGWSMSAVLSPVNPLNLLVSSAVKKPATIVGLRWNGAYLTVMFIIGTLYVYLLH